MTITELGALGEFFGAIAVVATLVYLALQIRQNSALLQANKESMEANSRISINAAYDQTFDHLSRIRLLRAGDGEVARIWRLGCGEENLEPDEQTRFSDLFEELFMARMMAFHRAATLEIPAIDFGAVRNMAGDLKDNPGLLVQWRNRVHTPASAGFREAVEGVLGEQETQ